MSKEIKNAVMYRVRAEKDGSSGFWKFEKCMDGWAYMTFLGPKEEIVDVCVVKTKNIDKIIKNAQAAQITVELMRRNDGEEKTESQED